MLVLILALSGVAGIIGGLFAFRFIRRITRDKVCPRRLITLRWVAVIIGILCGIASFPLTGLMGYSYTNSQGTGRIVGLPIMVAVFDAAGRDYVSPLSLPAALGNSAFWALFPQIVLSCYILAKR